jgi:threonine synthase
MRRKNMTESFKIIPRESERQAGAAKYYEFETFEYEYADIRQFPLPGCNGIERFLPLLPVEKLDALLQGTGDTPLIHSHKFGKEVGIPKLFIKDEGQNPSGCFKDRESAAVLSAALEKGYKEVYIVSSGNAALSTAALAQHVGIKCTCYVPEKTTEEKKQLIQLYGAKLVTIPGFYEDVYRKVVDMNPPGWNVTSGQNEYRLEGGKTLAFEIWEQLGGNVPDKVVIPSGNGGCLAATWNGFVELYKLGKIHKLPQMICVQIKGAAPIKAAFEQRVPFVVLGDIDDSIAEGIVAQESYCSPKAVDALIKSKGQVIEVTDDEVIKALGQVIRTESLVVEPTSAATFAALSKIKVDPEDVVVAVNTGTGMKVLGEIMHLLNKGGKHDIS